MSESVETLQSVQSKLELAKRRQDISIFQQIVEPLAEAIEELAGAIQTVKKEVVTQPDYFDKDFNKNVSSSISKIVGFLGQFKIDIDLSPINSIATEIKKQNEVLIRLLSESKSDEVYRLVVALIGKQTAFLEKSNQINYSTQLQSISDALNKKNNQVERLTITYGKYDDRINEIVPIYKKT